MADPCVQSKGDLLYSLHLSDNNFMPGLCKFCFSLLVIVAHLCGFQNPHDVITPFHFKQPPRQSQTDFSAESSFCVSFFEMSGLSLPSGRGSYGETHVEACTCCNVNIKDLDYIEYHQKLASLCTDGCMLR